MNNDVTIIPEVVGAFVTIVIGFYAIAKIMLRQASKDRDADRIERQELSRAIKLMAKSSAKVADVTESGMNKLAAATNRGSDEAKQRNGHLAELVAKSGEQTIAAIQTIGKQTITEQKIEHQVINTHEEKK